MVAQAAHREAILTILTVQPPPQEIVRLIPKDQQLLKQLSQPSDLDRPFERGHRRDQKSPVVVGAEAAVAEEDKSISWETHLAN